MNQDKLILPLAELAPQLDGNLVSLTHLLSKLSGANDRILFLKEVEASGVTDADFEKRHKLRSGTVQLIQAFTDSEWQKKTDRMRVLYINLKENAAKEGSASERDLIKADIALEMKAMLEYLENGFPEAHRLLSEYELAIARLSANERHSLFLLTQCYPPDDGHIDDNSFVPIFLIAIVFVAIVVYPGISGHRFLNSNKGCCSRPIPYAPAA